MRRYTAYAVVVVAAVLVLWAVTLGTNGRTKLYAGICQSWQQHWLPERGKYLPTRFGPLLKRTGVIAPIRYEIAPRASFLLDPLDVVDIALLAGTGWDDDVLSMISGSLKPGGTLIDVGAHIGTFTLQGARFVGDNGKVIAIEPNPKTFARLKDNVEYNGLRQVTLLQAASGDRPGRMKLYVGSSINSGIASLSRQNVLDQGGDGRIEVEVDVIPLDDIVDRAGLTRLDVIKVDTEGAETMIMRGAHQTLSRFKPVLVLETMDHHLRNLGSSLAELDALLKLEGYTIAERTGMNTKYVPKP